MIWCDASFGVQFDRVLRVYCCILCKRGLSKITPGPFYNQPGECNITEIGKSREKQYWKCQGFILPILTILAVRVLLHIGEEMLGKQKDKQVWNQEKGNWLEISIGGSPVYRCIEHGNGF